MSKIYVGNLPFTATEESVRELFAQHGTVESVALIKDRDTGQPRGFRLRRDAERRREPGDSGAERSADGWPPAQGQRSAGQAA